MATIAPQNVVDYMPRQSLDGGSGVPRLKKMLHGRSVIHLPVHQPRAPTQADNRLTSSSSLVSGYVITKTRRVVQWTSPSSNRTHFFVLFDSPDTAEAACQRSYTQWTAERLYGKTLQGYLETIDASAGRTAACKAAKTATKRNRAARRLQPKSASATTSHAGPSSQPSSLELTNPCTSTMPGQPSVSRRAPLVSDTPIHKSYQLLLPDSLAPQVDHSSEPSGLTAYGASDLNERAVAAYSGFTAPSLKRQLEDGEIYEHTQSSSLDHEASLPSPSSKRSRPHPRKEGSERDVMMSQEHGDDTPTSTEAAVSLLLPFPDCVKPRAHHIEDSVVREIEMKHTGCGEADHCGSGQDERPSISTQAHSFSHASEAEVVSGQEACHAQLEPRADPSYATTGLAETTRLQKELEQERSLRIAAESTCATLLKEQADRDALYPGLLHAYEMLQTVTTRVLAGQGI